MRRLTPPLVAAALTLLVLAATTGTALALPGWSTLSTPLAQTVRFDAAGVFGDAGVVVAGEGGAIAVSIDGGATWTDISATSLTSSALQGVAFSDAEHGVVVGQAGTILVGAPDDLGVFAWEAATRPDDVTSDLRDVAMSGTVGYAVGDGGVVLKTVDGGVTWMREAAPTAADLNAVAVSADGEVVVAVGAQGTLLVDQNGTWETRETGTTADLLDVTLPADSTAGIVYCCSADQVFSLQGSGPLTSLPAPPLATGGSISALALVESATSSRLVAGGTGGWVAGMATGGAAWTTQTGGAASDITSLAAGGAICYATAAGGQVERSLSAGAGFTLTLTATPSVKNTTYKAIVTTGAKVTLSGKTNLLAPGALILEAKLAGSTYWNTVAYGDPGATTLARSFSPNRTTTYRLRFLFAGSTAVTSTEVRVGVRHKVAVSATSYRLRLHAVYRVKGSVAPVAPAGSYVEVWTDRAGNHRLGAWHRISLGGVVRLAQGRTFTTRAFGTPVRETYHLKIRKPADSQHLEGWSARITVTVR